MPSTMEQAVRLAVTIENVERLRQIKEGIRKIFTARSEIKCYQCSELGHYARDCRVRGPNRETQANRGNRSMGGPSGQDFRKMARPWVPSGNSRPSGIQCFECQEFGHMPRDCPKLNRARARTRFDAQIPSVEPANYAKLGRLQMDVAGPELLLELDICGSLHHMLIDSGAK
jgi:hypothetical protein